MQIIFFFSFFALAYGHNWMQAPAAFNGNKASQGNKPCNAKTANYAPTTEALGSSVDVTWTTNHGGNHFVKVVAIADMDRMETLAAGDPALLYYFSGDKTAGKTSTFQITADKFTPGATYVLQYSWANYRNCAEFVVGAAEVAATVAPVNGAGSNSMAVGTGAGMPSQDPNAGVGAGDCNTYCEDFLSVCSSSPYVFSDTAECLDACAQYPTTGGWRDHTGNTFQCRWYHLHPDYDHDALVHCHHASKESTETTCQGGSGFLPAVNVQVMVDSQMGLAPDTIKGYMEDCLSRSGYTDVAVSTPQQGNGEYTMKVVFSDKSTTGETVDQKIRAIKYDDRPVNCMKQQAGVQEFTVADTMLDSRGAREESPAMILSAVAVLFYVFFQ